MSSQLHNKSHQFAPSAQDTHRPILLTSRGRGVAVLEYLHAIQEHYKEQGVPHIGDDFVAAILEHNASAPP